MKSLGQFTVSTEQSLAFARISGDFNPLHLDPVSARRTQFGHTLIHGVCGTLKALDLWLGTSINEASLLHLTVKYSKPATQGQELTVKGETSGGITRLEVFADSVRCQIIDFEISRTPISEISESRDALRAATSETASTCTVLTMADCNGLSGAVDLLWDNDLAATLFPNASRLIPKVQLATIIASTQIVGMRCPGLHSVFAQLQLQFSTSLEHNAPACYSQLEYDVLKADTRINQVQLGLENAFAKGTVEAFFRSTPVQQASFAEIETLVSNSEFENQNALIIGGSRGLGEVITKTLAAGGANVMMTYAVGMDDATGVAEEITGCRATPAVCCYNVLDGSPGSQMIRFFSSVSHIYYLASPNIEKGAGNTWSPQLFTRYCDFYLNGMAKLLEQIKQYASQDNEIQLFIPSSIFLEEKNEVMRGFDEYIASKAAAEAYVRNFERSNNNWHVFAPRLPRLHTDQTSGVRGIDKREVLDVIIGQLRQAFSQSHSA